MAATNGTVFGVFQGTSYATAFAFVPASQDIIQVVNEGGKVVWQLTSAGVANTNPASASTNALWRLFGSSLATAFTNTSSLDLLQIYSGTGETLISRVSSTGVVSST